MPPEEREFVASAALSQCGDLRAKARFYWAFLHPGKPAENVGSGRTGGANRIRTLDLDHPPLQGSGVL